MSNFEYMMTDPQYVLDNTGIRGIDLLTILVVFTCTCWVSILLVAICCCAAKARRIQQDAKNFIVPVNFDPATVTTKTDATEPTTMTEEVSTPTKRRKSGSKAIRVDSAFKVIKEPTEQDEEDYENL